MQLNTDYVAPAELTGYVRAAAADAPVNQFMLAQWLPNRNIDDLDYRITRGGEGLTEAAQYRAYDTEASIGARVGVTRISGELPPVSRKMLLGEYDRLRQRKQPDAVRQAILSDAVRVTRAVQARIELARGDALVKGKVTFAENSMEGMEADFSRASGHTSVAPSTPWSTVATATVLTDILTWIDTYTDDNSGEGPGAIVTTTPVWRYMLRNAEFRTLVSSIVGTPSRLAPSQLRGLLEDNDIPPIYLNDSKVSVAGVSTRVIPQDAFLLLPAPTSPNDPAGTQLGATLFGTTAESLEPEFGLEGEEPGIVAGTYRNPEPVQLWTKAAAIALPVLANPGLSFHADVF